jgi:hypothetical protein
VHTLTARSLKIIPGREEEVKNKRERKENDRRN